MKRDGVYNPVTQVSKAIETSKPRPAWHCLYVHVNWIPAVHAGMTRLKRDGVYNPVTQVSKAIETSKRFGRGCKPRPAWVYWVHCSLIEHIPVLWIPAFPAGMTV